jgi:hypothetical protein
MSPSAGRFLGRDPIGYEDGMSLYRSKLGLRFLDPNGLQCIEGWRGEACFNFTKFKVKGTLFGDVTPPFLGSWKDKWWIMQSGYFKGTLDASIDLGSGIPSDCLNKKSFEPGYNPSFGGS